MRSILYHNNFRFNRCLTIQILVIVSFGFLELEEISNEKACSIGGAFEDVLKKHNWLLQWIFFLCWTYYHCDHLVDLIMEFMFIKTMAEITKSSQGSISHSMISGKIVNEYFSESC